MIKILVNKERYYDEDLEDSDFDVKAEFSLPEDASAQSAVKMLAEALILDEYDSESVIRSFKEYYEKYSEKEDN